MNTDEIEVKGARVFEDIDAVRAAEQPLSENPYLDTLRIDDSALRDDAMSQVGEPGDANPYLNIAT